MSLPGLDLSGNDIGDGGAKYIANALKIDTSVKKLYLDFNKISNEGAKTFDNALAINNTLTDLELIHNKINQEEDKMIIASLSNSCDVTLELL